MQHESSTETQITDYFRQSERYLTREQEALHLLINDISLKKDMIKEKAMIAGLLEKLETEQDDVKLKIYRQALEFLLHGDSDRYRGK